MLAIGNSAVDNASLDSARAHIAYRYLIALHYQGKCPVGHCALHKKISVFVSSWQKRFSASVAKKINLANARFRLKNNARTCSFPSGRGTAFFLKTFRHRQKIFTTNNHYEWSKQPVAPEMLSLVHVIVKEFVVPQ